MVLVFKMIKPQNIKRISYRIDNLELRRTETISTKPRQYLEIVNWKNESCYTVASWSYNEDESIHFLEFVSDRYKDVDWDDFKKLIDVGFSCLSDDFIEECSE